MPQNQRPARTETVAGLTVIGRKEHVGFPAWNLGRIRAKIDTGAYSSAIDVWSYELIEGDERPLLRMVIALSRRRHEKVLRAEEPVVGMTRVRCSNGECQSRPVIEPVVRIGGVERRIRLTVSDRSRMRCRLLLGREAIGGQFLVDVTAKYLLDGAENPS